MTSPRPRGVLLDAAIIAAIKERVAQGETAKVIAKALGVSPASVYSHSSEVKRVPCPRCGRPKGPKAARCRRCNETAPTRAGWAQQAPRPRDDVQHGPGSQNGSAAPLEAVAGAYWQCSASPTGAHQWELDQQSQGACRCCGEVRQFYTWFRIDPRA